MNKTDEEPEQLQPPNSENRNVQDSEQQNIRKEITVFRGDGEKPSKAEKWLIAISFILAICNVLIIFYASNQAGAAIDAVALAKSQFDYQRDIDSIRSIREHNRDSVQSIKDSLFNDYQINRDSFSRRSFLLENRAFIEVYDYSPISFHYDGRPSAMDMILKNIGKTPAKWISKYSFIVFSEDSIAYNIELGKKFLERHIKEGLTLGANDTISIIHNLGILSNPDSSFIAKTQAIYMCILVGYSDVFGNHHITSDCRVLNLWDNEYRAYKKYNDIE